jgi:tetratricopeptide (TPR) repeat protein
MIVWLIAALSLSAEPSRDAIDRFTRTLETSWDTTGIDNYCTHFDVDALCERALINSGASDKFSAGFKKGLKSSFLESIRHGMRQFKSVKLLHTRKHEEHTVLVFRMISSEGALAYVQLLLSQESPPDTVAIIDAFAASSGEWTSQAIRRLALPAIVEENRSVIAKVLSPQEVDILKWAPKLTKATELMQAQEWERALNMLETFPDSLRQQSTLFALRIQCAQKFNQESYLKVLAEWEKTRPEDPALNLLAIDGYFIRKEYEKAHRAIDRLDKSIGGDPYLRLLHSYFYSHAKDLPSAEEHAIAACQAEPSLFAAWDQRMSTQLIQKKWPALASTLITLDQLFPGNTMDSILQDSAYDEFRKSENYSSWMSNRPGKLLQGSQLPSG